jgi:hypothetical protein
MHVPILKQGLGVIEQIGADAHVVVVVPRLIELLEGAEYHTKDAVAFRTCAVSTKAGTRAKNST